MFESYLTDRKQFLSINSFASSISSITCGVPQRSVLESLLLLLIFIFINKYTINKIPSIFTTWFTFALISHNCQTSFTSTGNFQILSVQTTSYGKNAFVYRAIRTWNDIQKEMKGFMLSTFSLVKLKSLLIEL